MAKPIPIKEQLVSAGRLAARSWAHANLWWAIASAESRTQNREVIDEYWECLRFVEQAHLFSYIVGVHALHHRRKGTINLPDLSASLNGIADDEIARAKDIHQKIEVLRHQVFAHRTDKATYDDVFCKAEILGDEIQSHADNTLRIANILLVQGGHKPTEVNDLPLISMREMLRSLRARS